MQERPTTNAISTGGFTGYLVLIVELVQFVTGFLVDVEFLGGLFELSHFGKDERTRVASGNNS